MKKNKGLIGPFRLSGLMVGPVLGSGIVLLPPMAADLMGASAIIAWGLILTLGAIFALIFSDLSVHYPSDGGMTYAVEKKLGKGAKLLTSLLMMSAVAFGPNAVMLTAAGYLRPLVSTGSSGISSHRIEVIIAMGLIVIAHLILRRSVKFVSTLSFITSVLIGILLTLSSLRWIWYHGINLNLEVPSVGVLGHTMMLLFWAIIGWEIVGNYATAVKSIEKTIPQATVMSLVAVTAIYASVALSVQSAPGQGFERIQNVMSYSFGSAGTVVLALLVTGLCLTTYLLIVGAVTRLMADLLSHLKVKRLPLRVLQKPTGALSFYSLLHLIVLSLVGMKWIELSGLVTVANGFFLANALVGLWAARLIVVHPVLRIGTIILVVAIVVLLAFSSPVVWVLMTMLSIFSFWIYPIQRRD